MSDCSDEGASNSSRRWRKGGNRKLDSSSDSESDEPRRKSNKRKKSHVLESGSSETGSNSECSDIISINRKRKKKLPRVESEESSSQESVDEDEEEGEAEDDENVVATRRNRASVIVSEGSDFDSESETEDGSSESGVSAGDSEDMYDSSYSVEEEAMVQAAIQESLAERGRRSESQKQEEEEMTKKAAAATAAGFTSDSSDGQSEKCPICLRNFTIQEVGSPETCDHTFCAVCIQEWAKNVNTCPVDRQVFRLILVRKQLNGKVVNRIPVENREARDLEEQQPEDPTFCEVCGRSDREDRLLLCDGCDQGYHLECLDPPLDNVPVEEWFCPDCASDNSRLAEAIDIQEGELFDLLDDEVQIRPRLARLLPRTRQSERVRATIRSLHRRMNGQSALQQTTSGIESMGADSGSVASDRRTASTTASTTTRRRRVVRRRTVKKRRKRRVTKRRTVKKKKRVPKKVGAEGTDEECEEDEEEYAPKKKRRKRRKRKVKRRKKKVIRKRRARTARTGQRPIAPRTVKGRLAEQLGLCPPNRAGVSLPVVRPRGSIPDIDIQRSRAGIPTLHIFGQQNQLDYFSSDDEEVGGEGGVAAIQPRNIHRNPTRLLAGKKMLSVAALQSHTAVAPRTARRRVLPDAQEQAPAAAGGSASSAFSSVDLIGSIMDSQKIWHSKSSAVTIRPDGSLHVNKPEQTGTISSLPSGVSDSATDRGDGDLVRSDNRLSDVNGSNDTPLDLRSAAGRTTQAPMYPGRGAGGGSSNGGGRPPPSPSFPHFGGNRYSAPSYQSYQGGRGFSAFSPSGSSFDASSTRAGYSNYLNSGLPPPLMGGAPVRFRVAPRYPMRRNLQQRQQTASPSDDKKSDDNGEDCQGPEEEDEEREDEEIDIYSDIETGGGGSGGPSGGGSEPDDVDRGVEPSYEALPPPPEPSALLMGFGEQALSEEEGNSDSELVIDDNGPLSPPPLPPQIPESEKYDPADPSRDSDDELSPPPTPPALRSLPAALSISSLVPNSCIPSEDIPLPPRPPSGMPYPSTTNLTPHIMHTSSTKAGYLHSPTYGESSASSAAREGVLTTVVKEVIQERLNVTSTIIRGPISASTADKDDDKDKDEDESDECPNFSVYSAASMDFARSHSEADVHTERVEPDNKINDKPQSDEKSEKSEKSDDVDEKMEVDNSEIENEDPSKTSEQSGDTSGSSSEKSEKSDKGKESDLKVHSPEGSGDDSSDSESSSDDSKSGAESDDAVQPPLSTGKKHEKPPSEISEDAECSVLVDDLEDSKPGEDLEKSKPAKEQDDSKPVIDLDDSKPAIDLDDSKPAIDLDDSKPAVDLDESKLDDGLDDLKLDDELEYSKSAGDRDDSKPSDNTDDAKQDEVDETLARPTTPEEQERKLVDEGKSETRKDDSLDSDDNDSLVGGTTSAISVITVDNNVPSSAPPVGLEGLDTETISETEEAINFGDISQDEKDLASGIEEGEITSGKRKKKKKTRSFDRDGKELNELRTEKHIEKERTPPEEGEIIDDRPKVHEPSKKEKEKKETGKREKEASKVTDENFDVSKQKDEEKKKKKKEKKSSDKKEVLMSSENKRKDKDKDRERKSDDGNISWKKPSKNTKERNYRDTKTSKPSDTSKEKEDKDESKDTGKKKKKEKRKDMERYDVRKIVSDKRRRRKDEFGRDQSRDRTRSRSGSRSHRRSRERSVSRTRNRSRHRSPVRTRRSQSRSRRSQSRTRRSRSRSRRSRSRSYRRSRSRSHRRSRSRSRNRRKSKDRSRRSRSKDRCRVRVSRSRSRGRRSRTRSRSRSRSKNKSRRSRSRSLKRRDRNDRGHATREVTRVHGRRSWSRTWTPSWSRSRSRSRSCSSFSHRSSASIGRFNRSYSRSFSRSWSRERYERIPLEKTGGLSNKAPKKLTVIVSNTKESSGSKKEKKKKKERKNKELLSEKRRKKKEKSPAPSKEVFTSGDNILVSINFNKSSKTAASKDGPVQGLQALQKDAAKRKRDDQFEAEREVGKKVRKEKAKDKNKGAAGEKNATGPQEGQKKKKVGLKGKSARLAALMKQKPVAIIDLDQSPFREQTPSPRDLIVLSDSDDDVRNKEVEREERVESLGVRRLRPDSASPQSPPKVGHNVPPSLTGSRTPESEMPLMSAVSSYLTTSTGPKTPPEPQQVKFSISTKQPQLRTINNPLQEDEDIPEDGGLDDSDQRIEEELDRSLGELGHKGPNTPPEPRGPTTPASPPISPDVYDPFDPTKSGTPSPAGPEASMDGPPSPPHTPVDEMAHGAVGEPAGRGSPLPSELEDMLNKDIEVRSKASPMAISSEPPPEELGTSPDRAKTVQRGDGNSPAGLSESLSMPSQMQNEEMPQVSEISEVSKTTHGLPTAVPPVTVSESSMKSPERKLSVVTTQAPKLQNTPLKPPLFPVPSLKQIPTSQAITSTPSHSNAPAPLFPALTPVNIANMLCTPPANLGLSRTNIFTPPTSLPTLLQHVANSTTPVQARMPDKPAAPVLKPAAPVLPIRSLVQNGEQPKQPLDTTTEVVDMDLDSPYSPGSSEGDDLFDPPSDTPPRASQPSHPTKPAQQGAKGGNKLPLPLPLPPNKDKFDSLFGKAGGAMGKAARKGHKGAKTKTKHMKGGRKEISIKMDEDQLQILDELPSSAVELQVKDKFLKKLNRQERVVEEVKLSLKPHYNRKHITKEEYKNILRKSVPKICHNKSGEINPVKIASLVEAYVRKVRYEKKKSANQNSGNNPTPAKAKVAKTTKWS